MVAVCVPDCVPEVLTAAPPGVTARFDVLPDAPIT